MESTTPVIAEATDDTPETWTWIGTDDRGLQLEIVALVKPDCLLVVHVMPTALRRKP